jgi:diaminohydroxyphosphoribosylaminopyrimidine deaminase/5-amino-6-(5-phosphoribosylamino)uracil reductase
MTVRTETDRLHLARAIEIAERGRGRVSPNPLVGAVIARDGEAISEGWHDELGGPHGERQAIAAAGDADLTGATMYVSLEPCCHQGRTPPCTDAIVEAGIRRVVVGSDDPTEKASGRGLGILRDEGIEVVVAGGELATRARLLNQPFRKHARTGRPWVVCKAAMSLDGKVATESGDSKWISSPASREVAHGWRAELDAVAVGIGTVFADDPLLTARDCDPPPARQPVRVVFDRRGRLPATSRLAMTAGPDAPVLVACDPDAQVRRRGVERLGVGSPGEALSELARRRIASVLLEGGATIATALADAGLVDRLMVFRAPIELGDGPGLFTRAVDLPPPVEERRIGLDILTVTELREV